MLTRPWRIVAVDDDRNVRRLIGEVFRPPRFEAHAFARAEEALASITDTTPDLVLCDYLMPGMAVDALLEAVRASEETRDLPFLFLTAVALSEDEAREIGATTVLRKPIPIEELRRQVETHLPPQSPREEHRTTSIRSAAPARRRPELGLPLRPYGRYSSVRHGNRTVQVLTEELHAETFTIVTVVTGAGVALRRLESSLAHPLARREDVAIAEREVDLQHDAVIANLDRYVLEARRASVWAAHERQIPVSLLSWVTDRVEEHVAERWGGESARGILADTLARRAAADPRLRPFRYRADEGMSYESADVREAPLEAATALAGWMLDLARQALDTDESSAAAAVARLVRTRADELRRFGFMRAIDAARSEESARDRVRVEGLDGTRRL